MKSIKSVKRLSSGMWSARAYYKDPVTGKVSRPCFSASSRIEAFRLATMWEISMHERSESKEA